MVRGLSGECEGEQAEHSKAVGFRLKQVDTSRSKLGELQLELCGL